MTSALALERFGKNVCNFQLEFSQVQVSPLRESRRVAVKVAGDLVESKIQETRDGKSGRDILTLLGAFGLWFLINASRSSNKENRLSGIELVDQMRQVLRSSYTRAIPKYDSPGPLLLLGVSDYKFSPHRVS